MKIILPSAVLAVLVVTCAVSSVAQTQIPPPDEVTVVYGQKIHYVEAGQGPAVILLHGLGAVKEIWGASMGPLSAKYHVYALDQIGFGLSDKPLLDYRIATFTDFVFGFMEVQHLSKATLVGNSLGGWIALDFALQHPEMVDKVVLVDAAGLPWQQQSGPAINLNPASFAATRKMLEALFYDKKKMVTELFAQAVFISHMRNNDGYTIDRTLQGFATENQFLNEAKLGSIHAPTLVVWGREDALIPLASGEKFRDHIPGAKMVVFDQCGHVPQIEKAPEFNRAVLDFLSK
jgi:pimeloyl-ACP methyl ester carboxylesterase